MRDSGRDPDEQAARRRRRRVILALLVPVVVATLWYFRRPLFGGNLDVVDPGRAYRSAQPGPGLERAIGELGLASILNLRGGSFGDAFYRDEVGTAARLGVAFYDLPMSATERPSRRDLLLLADVLEACRYPLLIHCKSGADRTGLACALYRMLRRGEGPEEALTAFSLAHGHVPWLGPERLHEPIEEYGRWLHGQGLGHTPGRFRDWLAREYRDPDPPPGPGERPTLPPGPRALVEGHPARTNHPARAGVQSQVVRRDGPRLGLGVGRRAGADASSSVSTTSDATSHSIGTSRR